MKDRKHTVNALREFLTEVGIPLCIVSDNAGEQVSEEWQAELRKYLISQHTSEPYHQHQNRAEPRIGNLKSEALKILNTSGAPGKYWCYAWELANDIINVTAVESLNWRTPWELAKGETPDISPFYQFRFYDKVRYTVPGIAFPNDKDLPGRYLGIAWHTGDILTYKIEPDHVRGNYNRHECVFRSAVTLDHGLNERMNVERKPDPNFEPHTWEQVFGLESDQTQDNQEILVEDVDDEEEKKFSTSSETYHDIASSEEMSPDEDGEFISKILGHRTGRKKRRPELLVQWSDGEKEWQVWEPFRLVKSDYPDMVSQYVLEHKLGHPFTPNWAKNVQSFIRRFKIISRYVLRRQ
jgi:hypothetical protein